MATEATLNVLDLSHPAIAYSKAATAALHELPMAEGAHWVLHLLRFRGKGLQREEPLEPTPIYTPDKKTNKCYWHKGTPSYARAGSHVHLVHHLNVQWRLSVYEVVEDRRQLNVIETHVPFDDAMEPFLRALAEAYRQKAMLALTIIIGDMNATPSLVNHWRQARPQGDAVCDTMNMLGLVDVTAALEGQPSHFPHRTLAVPSGINVCYGDRTTIIWADPWYVLLPLGPTGHRPLHLRLTIRNLPPIPLEDADQSFPDPRKIPPVHDEQAWSQYHRAIDRPQGNQQDLTELLTAIRTATVARGFQQQLQAEDNQPTSAGGNMLHALGHAKQHLTTHLHTDTPQACHHIHDCITQIAHIRADLAQWHIHREQRIAQEHEQYAATNSPTKPYATSTTP